jgi:hypothetical protein
MSSNQGDGGLDTSFWDQRRNIIRTRVGGALIGEGVVTSHGYSMLEDLTGHATFFQVLILNVTGNLPEKRLGDWLEATFICMSWPDPRIWCNGVGSYGGTLRTSPVAAITAGTLSADSKLYGPGTVTMVADSIREAVQYKRSGHDIREIVSRLNRKRSSPTPVIPGYARPIAAGDERVPVMDRVARALGFGTGEHLTAAYDIHEYLMRRYSESINLAGYMVSFLLDQDVSPRHIYRLYAMCVNSGIHACYGEAADNPPEAFLPLRCDDIDYQGRSRRTLPA